MLPGLDAKPLWWKRVQALFYSAGASLIGFVQAGFGAIRRTIQAKLEESVSVEDFTGAHEASTGLDAAPAFLLACQSLGARGGIVHFRKQYNILTNLVVPDNVTLRGRFPRPQWANGINYDTPYQNLGSSLRVASTATISLGYGSFVDQALVYRHGMTFPATSEAAYRGCAITYRANAAGVINSTIIGFRRPVAPPLTTQTFTATPGQTVFAVTGGYVAGQVAAYKNGARLKILGVDFTASNGTTVTLAAACAGGETIEIEKFGAGGPQEVRCENLAVDCVNGPMQINSIDTSRFIGIGCYPFGTVGYYAANFPSVPASVLQRSGIGLELVDPAADTVVDQVEIIGYAVNYRFAGSSINAGQIWSDHFAALAGSDVTSTIGVLFDSGSAATTVASLHAWSSEQNVVSISQPGQTVNVGTMQNHGATGHAITIGGGNFDCVNAQITDCGGYAVNVLDVNSKVRVHGRAYGVAAGAVVSTPGSPKYDSIDVRLQTDKALGAQYFTAAPAFTGLTVAGPLNLPQPSGREVDTYEVYGTAPGLGNMYGGEGCRDVELWIVDGTTWFTGGNVDLPGATNLVLAAGAIVSLRWNPRTGSWRIVSRVA